MFLMVLVDGLLKNRTNDELNSVGKINAEDLGSKNSDLVISIVSLFFSGNWQ